MKRNKLSNMHLRLSTLATALLFAIPTLAADRTIEDLKGLSLEQLANMQVSILSKKPERLADSAAAVFVLTSEDIRRSGYSTIPELLRLVPGMNVARIDTSEWAISSRGFNSRFANKLLVMVDGRSVYNSLFSGVYWEALDTLLPDVERIEIIRGPGASTWGANAVNGVINIITKNASDTLGVLATAHAGNQQRGGAVRYGTQTGESGSVRAYMKYDNRDPEKKLASGLDIKDFYGKRFGARGDWEPSSDDAVSIQGELFDANAEDPWLSGGNLMTQWQHIRASGAEDSFQAYYSRFKMESDSDHVSVQELEDTVDLEYRHQFVPLGRHDLIGGLGYRWQRSNIRGAGLTHAEPPERTYSRISAFFQDDIALVDDRWFLTLGTKLEHNDFTGFEIQPTIRTRWHPQPNSTLWASVSRAVRTPNRAEHDLAAEQLALPPSPSTGGLPVYYRTTTNREMESETLVAYEAGYRWQPAKRLGMDLSLFYNDYEELRTLELGSPTLDPQPFPRWIVPTTAENRMQGHSYGMELTADWRLTDELRLQGWYSLLKMDLTVDEGSDSLESADIQKQSPEQQAGLRSALNLPHDMELDLFLRYVGALKEFKVDDYVELDARLGWNIKDNLSLSLIGRNLLQSSHQEFGTEAILNAPPHEIVHELFLRAELKY
ncbi:TonB-dependent receptor plug domain-containing protein [Thiolapillus brandeum]|uniref:Iron complex outermembrane recepter protein n=1 Tax=Thiolapillus brandeum TaxID=1076588 RepID=A0A7U6GI69_9GAMM|nr:TonB-dependent receptor [Thiolapillus brandeum]BAO44101.1 iron complex outermembrane recepter protein [Thiolapillus brandeum]